MSRLDRIQCRTHWKGNAAVKSRGPGSKRGHVEIQVMSSAPWGRGDTLSNGHPAERVQREAARQVIRGQILNWCQPAQLQRWQCQSQWSDADFPLIGELAPLTSRDGTRYLNLRVFTLIA